ncbi:MAG: acetolactate decarboxylase, partial [Firmicutes bacterium]|nr:acetolactate decarboxylase [Bacillota bacterium]
AMLVVLSGCGTAAPATQATAQTEQPAAQTEAQPAAADRETIFQVSLLQGLTLGDYYGSVTVKELKEKGDTGIGTFEGVNGELIMLDGEVYRAKSDGSVEIAPDDETIPFSNVTFFDADTTEELSGISNINDLKDYLNGKVEEFGKNRFYMIRIDGNFKKVSARSELKQEEPYKTLAEALSTDQREFDFDETKGTVVGLFCPEYMNDLNAVGWHFHFVSEDKQNGGHVLDLDIDNAEVKWDNTDGFNMLLPETKMFPELDLTQDQSADIKKVETNE